MLKLFIFILLIVALSACQEEKPAVDRLTPAYAKELSQKFILVDTHIDVPFRLKMKMQDVSKKTAGGDFDYPRAIQGGLDAPFMSIFVPAKKEFNGAKALADELIDLVEALAVNSPDKFALAYDPADLEKNHINGLISLPMGMENGSPVEGKLENIKYFYDRGIRYITLAHAKSNHICDSSYDPERKWGGLSPFGKDVVLEMNRVGIMVDVSHVTDSSFYQILRISKTPVIASHSSCRFFTPGFERNMSDDMIKTLAAHGGVIQMNFGSSFINQDYREKMERFQKYAKEHHLRWGTPDFEESLTLFKKENDVREASAADVAAHIDHVAKLVGVDHIGIGSDFDGLGDSLPEGLKDVSQYPNLIFELLKLGYSDEEIQKICSGNLIRVWRFVAEYAESLKIG